MKKMKVRRKKMRTIRRKKTKSNRLGKKDRWS